MDNLPWVQFPNAIDWYQKILESFHFSHEDDLKARDLLFKLKKHSNPENLIQKIRTEQQRKSILFFGAGPNLERHLGQISLQIHKNRSHFFITAADGSANGLRIANLMPDLIISDLDGISLEDLTYFLQKGVIVIIHGHGDNIIKIQEFSSIIQKSNSIMCTTQTEAKYPIFNPGGFTDGDRGVFLLHHLADSQKVFWLFGYEFGEYIGSFSKKGFTHSKPITILKKKKLKFAQELLNELKFTFHRQIKFFGENPIEDLKFPHFQ
jgi:hypothetical protein